MADPSRVRVAGLLQPVAVGFAAELERKATHHAPCRRSCI